LLGFCQLFGALFRVPTAVRFPLFGKFRLVLFFLSQLFWSWQQFLFWRIKPTNEVKVDFNRLSALTA
jgi:hypothetical protein